MINKYYNSNTIVVSAVFFLAFAIIFDNIFIGLAEDADSGAILNSINIINSGSYMPSRMFGVPGYEFISAWLYGLGGVDAVNLFSVILWTLFSLTVYRVLDGIFSKDTWIVFVAVCLHPVVLLNATVMMETMQALLLVALSVFYYLRVLANNDQVNFNLTILAIINVLMVLTRPDMIFFSAALIISLLLCKKTTDNRMKIVAAGLLSAASIVLIYLSLYTYFNVDFPSRSISIEFNLAHAARVVAGVINLFGIFFLVAFPVLIVMKVNEAKRFDVNHVLDNPVALLFVISVVIYAIRWFILPHETEYLLVPFLVTSFFIHQKFSLSFKYSFLLSILSMHLLMPTFLSKEAVAADQLFNSTYNIALSTSPGILYQDIEYRKLKKYIKSDEFIDDLQQALEFDLHKVEVTPFTPGFIVNSEVFVSSKIGMWLVAKDHEQLSQLNEKFNNIYVCEEDIVPNRGWRVMQKPVYYQPSQNSRLSCKEL